jgi:hypothetical protein
MTKEQLNLGFEQVLATMLWSSYDDDEPLDENYSILDIDDESKFVLWEKYKGFINDNLELILESSLSYEDIGHNFWLTCNGHGSGFWDRELGEIGDKLTEACKIIGSSDPYVGDDGLIYI